MVDEKIHQQGGRRIIVQQLELDPARPIVAATPARLSETLIAEDAATIPPTDEERAAAAAGFHLFHLSATVFPGPLTRLRWYHLDQTGERNEYTGWSNIDFNHLSGFASFRDSGGVEHNLVLGIGNSEISGHLRSPSFPDNTPTLIPDDPATPPAALKTLTALHELYTAQGPRLAAAHQGRERARLVREAELLANPPQPKDLIIRYRVAETPLQTPAE